MKDPTRSRPTIGLAAVIAVPLLSLLYAYWVYRSTLLISIVALWCVVSIIIPVILYRRLIRRGTTTAPTGKWMARIYGGLTIYTLGLAGFEFWTGASPKLWIWSLVASGAFLVATVASRREFA